MNLYYLELIEGYLLIIFFLVLIIPNGTIENTEEMLDAIFATGLAIIGLMFIINAENKIQIEKLKQEIKRWKNDKK